MNLSLYTTATLFITGIGIFLLGITVPTLIREMQYNNHNSFFPEGFGLFLIFGIGYFTAGIIMLLRLQIAVRITNLILVGSMMGWMYFFYIEIFNKVGNDGMLVYPMSLFVLIFIIILTLFINNDKVLASINEVGQEELSEDLLDQL